MNFNGKEMLYELTGDGFSRNFGITETNAIEIISEVGLDMSKWPTVKHFTSWLNLAPNNKISGGKVLSSRIPKRKTTQVKYLEWRRLPYSVAKIG
ncbi:MAG: transposase [Saprospiraceae bacterium]|nr:transposase [Candidatus Vicinibacter affinis]